MATRGICWRCWTSCPCTRGWNHSKTRPAGPWPKHGNASWNGRIRVVRVNCKWIKAKNFTIARFNRSWKNTPFTTFPPTGIPKPRSSNGLTAPSKNACIVIWPLPTPWSSWTCSPRWCKGTTPAGIAALGGRPKTSRPTTNWRCGTVCIPHPFHPSPRPSWRWATGSVWAKRRAPFAKATYPGGPKKCLWSAGWCPAACPPTKWKNSTAP